MNEIVINVRCRTCGNEDEVEVTQEIGMLPNGLMVTAKAQVRECRLCQRPLLGVTR